MAIADNHNISRQALNGENGNSSLEAQIVSQTPGRVRLRVLPGHRQQQKIIPIIDALQARLEIYGVRTNILGGSITVFYGRELLSSQDMCMVLHDLGINLVETTQDAIEFGSKPSSAAAEVIETATELNRRVRRATDDAIDLRFLFPLSLGVLAARQLVVKGWQLELIPWYVLAWYAFDSFLKLHSTSSISRSNTRS